MLALLSALAMTSTASSLRLPAVIGDHMVLPRGTTAPLWGWTAPGRTVTVQYGRTRASALAGPDGRWEVSLKGLRTAEPKALRVSDGVETRTLQNVVVGDVWICSGQSNMEWPVVAAKDGVAEAARAGDPQLRLFQVANRTTPTADGDVQGRWVVATPETVAQFSAVGLFFGQHLRRSQRVPIGLIDTTWGGTRAEAWTPRPALLQSPVFSPDARRYEAERAARQPEFEAYRRAVDERGGQYMKDTGNEGEPRGWARSDFDDTGWEAIPVPSILETLGPDKVLDGAYWLRTPFDVPQRWRGKRLTLSLGPIDDFDTTYVDGTRVGGMGLETPNFWMTPRVYDVPAMEPGRHTLAIRVFDHFGNSGVYGTPDQLWIGVGEDRLPLSGMWRFQVERKVPQLGAPPPGFDAEQGPGNLYAAMVQPLAPFAVHGTIWYQGESNADQAYRYRELMALLIGEWRVAFRRPTMPFLVVQLANWQPRKPHPGESAWAELREAQSQLQAIPGIGVAVAIDIGEADDIHPRNKQEVGRRLALLAQPTMKQRSPFFRRAARRGNAIELQFDHAGSLTTSDGRPPVGFAVAGEDRQWVWAEASIERNRIRVWSPTVAKPVAVRYGWADNPDVNVVNEFGLPLSPFRTDDWPRTTQPRSSAL